MKVLLINDLAVPNGGAERMTLMLQEELKTRGHDACIFASTATEIAGNSFADYSCFGTTGPFRTLNRVFNISAANQLRQVLESFQPDVVHVRMFLTQLSPSIMPLLRTVPSLYHAIWYESICPTGLKLLPDHSLCEDKAGYVCRRHGCLSPQAWAVLMIQLRLWRHWQKVFNLIVANSLAVKQLLLKNGIAPVRVVHNGVPVTRNRPLLTSPPMISFSSRLSREKGVDLLVQAFAKVVAQIPTARLMIAGDGPLREPLKKQIRDLNLEANVSLLGHLSRAEIEVKLASAWVQVVPSQVSEPFGLAAAEAMMRGTAVIATNTGGLSEIVVRDRTGLLVPRNDVEALAASIMQLLRNRSLAEDMGRHGRQRAIKHFSQRVCTEKFIELYHTIVRKKGATANVC